MATAITRPSFTSQRNSTKELRTQVDRGGQGAHANEEVSEHDGAGGELHALVFAQQGDSYMDHDGMCVPGLDNVFPVTKQHRVSYCRSPAQLGISTTSTRAFSMT